MKRQNYSEIIVAEHYLYDVCNEEDIFNEPVTGVWFFAILTVDEKPSMVTCRLGPEFAWRSQAFVLDYLKNNPSVWLDQDDSTLLSEPVPRRVILIDLVERAVLEQALSCPDSVRRCESSLPQDCQRGSTPFVA